MHSSRHKRCVEMLRLTVRHSVLGPRLFVLSSQPHLRTHLAFGEVSGVREGCLVISASHLGAGNLLGATPSRFVEDVLQTGLELGPSLTSSNPSLECGSELVSCGLGDCSCRLGCS